MFKLHCHSTLHPESIAPLITSTLHACIIALLLWKIPRLHDLEAAACYVFW